MCCGYRTGYRCGLLYARVRLQCVVKRTNAVKCCKSLIEGNNLRISVCGRVNFVSKSIFGMALSRKNVRTRHLVFSWA